MSNIVLETIIELINKNIDNNNVKKEEINDRNKKVNRKKLIILLNIPK